MVSSLLISAYKEQQGCVISEAIYVASLIVALGLSFFVTEDLRRQNTEN